MPYFGTTGLYPVKLKRSLSRIGRRAVTREPPGAICLALAPSVPVGDHRREFLFCPGLTCIPFLGVLRFQAPPEVPSNLWCK